MAALGGWTIIFFTLFGILLSFVQCTVVGNEGQTQFCSFFNNRAPTAQPGLKNCTWFKESSCCMQQEIKATFDKMKPLQGASLACQKYINYLMCYICAPNQNLFYRKERLTVCEDFCDELYSACNSAILKGSVIGQLYANGKEFCLSRRFEVNTASCFTFDHQLDVRSNSARDVRGMPMLLLISLLCLLCNLCPASLQPSSVTKTISRTPHNSRRHKAGERCWSSLCGIAFSIVLLVLSPGCHATTTDTTNKPVTHDEVITWAKIISNSFIRLGRQGLHHDAIQEKYDNAKYQQEIVNGSAKVEQIRHKLAEFFSLKKRLAQKLAEQVTACHDAWLQQGNHSDQASMVTRLEDLEFDEYKDADLPHRLPEDLMHYDSVFKSHIMSNHSTVKIPDGVLRDSPSLAGSVQWSAGLEETFREISNEDADIRWQYFGSNTGMHRTFPGHEWPRNFVGFHEDYDPRTRPWYIGASSGPKDVVLILDGSASMATQDNLSRLRQTASYLLQTLSKHDYVNVIISRSGYYDNKGQHYNQTAKVLSCNVAELVPASGSHLKAITAAVDAMEALGGSNHTEAFRLAFSMLEQRESADPGCQKLVLFVTDGHKDDVDIYCDAGFYKYDQENRKQYIRGRICEYEWEEIYTLVNALQKKLQHPVPIFSFVTEDDKSKHDFPGTLACNNNGALAKVTSGGDPFSEMEAYFGFLQKSGGATEAVWTSPYMDSGGLGLMVSLSLPVYSNMTGQSLGVVGLDVTLERLAVLMRHDTWGSVYAFMVDRDDGSTVIHPRLKPAAQLLNDPVFVSIMSLETNNKQPHEFEEVLRSLEASETGDRKIIHNALRAIATETAPHWQPAEYSHYFYTDVPDSDFSIAINLAKSDENYWFAKEYADNEQIISYLDDMNMYDGLYEHVPGAFFELLPSETTLKYPGLEVSMSHSVVKLAPRSFCDPSAYLEQNSPSFLEIHNYINAFRPMWELPCPAGDYRTDTRPDVKLTRSLEPLWLSRASGLQTDILWTYIGTSSGVMRIYPGVTLLRDYDPTVRPWYTRAAANRGLLAVSSVYQDYSTKRKIITLSRTVHKSQPQSPTQCQASVEGSGPPYYPPGARRDYGCPCDVNSQCKSDYCSAATLTCTDDVTQGVVGMDMGYPSIHREITEEIQFQAGSRNQYCGHIATCSHGRKCATKCYVVDDRGLLVLDDTYLQTPDSAPSEYSHVSLAARHGYIFQQLVHQGVYQQHVTVDYQAACRIGEEGVAQNASSFSTVIPWMSSPSSVPKSLPGPFPSFPSQYGCIKEVTYYTDNKTVLPLGALINGSLADDPCSHGYYFFTTIPDTNLYLLVLSEYEDLQRPWNLNCYLANKVHMPGAVEVRHGTCAGEYAPILYRRLRTCQNQTQVQVPCVYSAATYWTVSIHCTVLFGLLSLILYC